MTNTSVDSMTINEITMTIALLKVGVNKISIKQDA